MYDGEQSVHTLELDPRKEDGGCGRSNRRPFLKKLLGFMFN